MIRKKVIIDTGPLVAYLNKNDSHHQWAVTQFTQLSPPFISCESVLSEASFLLRGYANGLSAVLEFIERELIILPFDFVAEVKTIKYLMDKYKDIPMSLADACLVRMSEQISDSIICTLDSDFKIYRKHKRDIIPLIFPGKE